MTVLLWEFRKYSYDLAVIFATLIISSAAGAAPDYYQVLGVSRKASADDIQRAFRVKARAVHPDHNSNDPKAAEKFRLIVEAREALLNRNTNTSHSTDPSGFASVPDEVIREQWRAPNITLPTTSAAYGIHPFDVYEKTLQLVETMMRQQTDYEEMVAEVTEALRKQLNLSSILQAGAIVYTKTKSAELEYRYALIKEMFRAGNISPSNSGRELGTLRVEIVTKASLLFLNDFSAYDLEYFEVAHKDFLIDLEGKANFYRFFGSPESAKIMSELVSFGKMHKGKPQPKGLLKKIMSCLSLLGGKDTRSDQ